MSVSVAPSWGNWYGVVAKCTKLHGRLPVTEDSSQQVYLCMSICLPQAVEPSNRKRRRRNSGRYNGPHQVTCIGPVAKPARKTNGYWVKDYWKFCESLRSHIEWNCEGTRKKRKKWDVICSGCAGAISVKCEEIWDDGIWRRLSSIHKAHQQRFDKTI